MQTDNKDKSLVWLSASMRRQTTGNPLPYVPTKTATDLLAPWAYHNDELLALEREHLFRRSWLLAGHVSDIPAARDFLTLDAVGERALVVRGDDGVVRGFHNVCRHRGAKLVNETRGRCPMMLSCPFHGWTYDLGGALVSVPAQHTFDALDKSAHGLAPLAVEIWMGFVFVRFAGDGVSLAETMAPVEKLIATYRLAEIQPLENSRVSEMRPYNWKTIHDIDNEGYHVPVGHPWLYQLYGNNYRDDFIGDVSVSFGYLNERPGKLWSVRHYQKLLPEFAHLPPEQRRLWLYVGIFPSTVLALYPESMEFYQSLPVTTGSSRFVGGGYALPDDRRAARAARYLGMRINRATDVEDDSFVRQLHEGMLSSAFPTPQLSSKEHAVRDFHDKIRRIIPVAKLAEAPRMGDVAEVNSRMGTDDLSLQKAQT